MQDLYETLGVARDASPDEIRAAYRRAARAAHPDREGGSTERMQAVNGAYVVLSDAERRQAYDQGEAADSPDAIPRAILRSIFADAIRDDAPDVLRYAQDKLRRSEAGARAEADTQRRAINRLEKQRQRITAKGPHDLYHEILEKAISKAKAELQSLEQNLVHAARVREILTAEYERGSNCPDPQEVQHGEFAIDSRFASAFLRNGMFDRYERF